MVEKFKTFNLADVSKQPKKDGTFFWVYDKNGEMYILPEKLGWKEDLENGMLYNIDDKNYHEMIMSRKVNTDAAQIIRTKSPVISEIHHSSIIISKYHKQALECNNINLSNLVRSFLDYCINHDLLKLNTQS